jgi:hypothetical protein
MRRPVLAVVLAVIAMLCGPVAVPSSSAVAASPVPTTFVRSFIADLPPPISGIPYGYQALLVDSGDNSAVPGRRVELWAEQAGQAAFTKVAEGVTSQTGFASVSAALTKNAQTYWAFAGDATYAPSRSDVSPISVATTGTMHAHRRTARTGQRIVVSGTTSPTKVKRRVSLWLGTIPAQWSPVIQFPRPVRLARGYTRADGTFRLVKGFSNTGRKKLFVRLPGGDGNIHGYVGYVRVRIR